MYISFKHISINKSVGWCTMKSRILVRLAILGSVLSAAISLECYSCVSSIDVDCARKPGKQLDVEECQRTDDSCVTTIISGVTYRGCLSRVLPNKFCSNLCEKCNTSLCNVEIYPLDRLRCYQCLGSDCIDVQNSTTHLPMACPIYKDADRCYTNIISINTVKRGCEATDLTGTSGCENICLKCNYDGCNDEQGATHHHCLECTYTQPSSMNSECLRNQEDFIGECAVTSPKTCYNKVVHGHKGKCFTYINPQTNVVNRGCSSSMGFYPSGDLKECYGELCNTDCFDIMCNVCDTTENSSCRNQTSVLRANKCRAGTTSCFSCEEGEHLWRGCGSDLPQPRANRTCHQCRDANGCNRQSIRSCYKCSSYDEENCASWTDISNITVSNCSHPAEKCVSTLVSRLNIVYTLRGCSSHVNECTESDPFCDRCDGSLCNIGPKTWELEPRNKKYLTWWQYYKTRKSNANSLKLGRKPWYILIYAWIVYVLYFNNIICKD